MNNRILISAVAVCITAASGSALADNGRHRGDRNHDNRDSDYARVLRVEPVMQRVRYTVPVERCWNEERVRSDRRSSNAGAAIVGGAIGAILGNRISDGRGVATLGGAVVGAALGNEIGKADGRRDYREPRYAQVQRCRTLQEERFEEHVAGYRVTYEYNGRHQVTQLPYDPGRYLRVAVDVHPLG
ncbi:MAG: glycine zipper 2TM domain-containing protein [Steroidobacteraceae bacterium]